MRAGPRRVADRDRLDCNRIYLGWRRISSLRLTMHAKALILVCGSQITQLIARPSAKPICTARSVPATSVTKRGLKHAADGRLKEGHPVAQPFRRWEDETLRARRRCSNWARRCWVSALEWMQLPRPFIKVARGINRAPYDLSSNPPTTFE